METDRRLSEYMGSRNTTAYRVSRAVASQFLIFAVFLCCYMVLQNSGHMDISLGLLRRIVIVVIGVLELFTMIYGIYVSICAFDKGIAGPDEPGIRQSREIIQYAYDNAKGALIYKITLSVVMLTTGTLAMITIITVTNGSERGNIISKVVFMLAVVGFFLLFIPSYDRLRTYRSILNNRVLLDVGQSFAGSSFTKGKAILLSVMAPASAYVFILWRFFGDKRTIAWIVFAVAALLYLAFCILMEYNVTEKTK